MILEVRYHVMDRDQYEGRKSRYDPFKIKFIKVDVLHVSDAIEAAQEALFDAILGAGHDYYGVGRDYHDGTCKTLIVTDDAGEIIEAYDQWTVGPDFCGVDAVVEFCESVESWDAPYIEEAFEALADYADLDMDDYRDDRGALDIGDFLDAVDAKLHTHLN